MTGQRQGEEGHQGERDVAMPAMPTADFVVVEPDFPLGEVEDILDRPARPSGVNNLRQGVSTGA